MRQLLHPQLWRVVLVAMLIPLAFVAFWPTPVDQPIQGQLAIMLRFLHRHGIPAWFNYKFVEAAANVVLFIPLGFIGSCAFPTKPWWLISAAGLIISCCIEFGQLLFIHNRFATPQDIVTNASGAVIGALLAAATLKKLEARRLSAAGLQQVE